VAEGCSIFSEYRVECLKQDREGEEIATGKVDGRVGCEVFNISCHAQEPGLEDAGGQDFG